MKPRSFSGDSFRKREGRCYYVNVGDSTVDAGGEELYENVSSHVIDCQCDLDIMFCQ